jgi:hypothetical protein
MVGYWPLFARMPAIIILMVSSVTLLVVVSGNSSTSIHCRSCSSGSICRSYFMVGYWPMFARMPAIIILMVISVSSSIW